MSLFYDSYVVAHPLYYGDGYLAGSLPPDPNPDEVDGRTKIMNVPARVQVAIVDRPTMFCIARVLSNTDGTWLVDRLNRNRQYLVIGYDGNSAVNAAVQDCVVPVAMG